MSNRLFPTFAPNLGVAAWPVKKAPSFKTIVQTPASNKGENRISLTPNPIYDFEYDYSYLSGDYQTLNSALSNLVGFHCSMGGAANDWLFQDPYDNTATGALLGYGDGTTTTFQLARLLGSGFYDPIQNPQAISALYINGLSRAALNYPIPANPSLAQVTLGSLGALTNFIKVTWVLTSGESVPSAEVSLATSANKVVQVTQPANPPVDAVGWNVYGSTSTGTEVLQTPTYLPLATTTWTEAATGMVTGTRTFPAFAAWQLGVENLIFYSQDFSQTSVWGYVNTAVTPNSTTAPDGTTTANKIARTGSAGSYYFGQTQNPSPYAPGDTVTFSGWFLQGTAGVQVQLIVYCMAANGSIIVNFSTGAVSLSSAWQRISCTGQIPIGATQVSIDIILLGTTGAGNFIYGWGMQGERGAIPTGYLTTATSPAQPKGLVQLASGSVPSAGASVSADFSFYFRCRFLEDEWNDLEEFLYQVWENKSVKFKSLIL